MLLCVRLSLSVCGVCVCLCVYFLPKLYLKYNIVNTFHLYLSKNKAWCNFFFHFFFGLIWFFLLLKSCYIYEMCFVLLFYFQHCWGGSRFVCFFYMVCLFVFNLFSSNLNWVLENYILLQHIFWAYTSVSFIGSGCLWIWFLLQCVVGVGFLFNKMRRWGRANATLYSTM